MLAADMQRMQSASEWRQARGLRWFWTSLAFVVACAVGTIPIGALAVARSAGQAGWAVLAVVTFGSFAVVLFRTSWRIPHARVEISPESVTVVGPVRTRVVPIAEADRFATRNLGGNQPTVVLLRQRGRPIWLWIFNRNGAIWQFNRFLDDLQPKTDELNRALGLARAASGCPRHSGLRSSGRRVGLDSE